MDLNQEQYTIAVVDRNRNIRNLVRRELLKEGYQVIVMDCKEFANLSKEENLRCDLLILDVDIGDDYVLRALLNSIARGDSLVLFHTCLPEKWLEELGMRACCDYDRIRVVKKESLEELKTAVKETLIGRKKAEADSRKGLW